MSRNNTKTLAAEHRISHENQAPFVSVASFCGSGLWPRCGVCRPRASFEAASRASPLPPNPGSARVCRELLWERPLAAIRRMPAAGFVRELIAGKPAPTKPRLRSCLSRVFVGAASGRDTAHAGRRLRSRADRGQARSHQTPAPFVFVTSFCGSGLWPRCGVCRPQASFGAASRASPLPRKPGSVRVCRELLWEWPLAAMRRMPAAGFVRGCIAGKPAPTKTRLRSCLSRVLVGAASGRDAAHAGRGLRSKLHRGQARSHENQAPFVFVASFCGSGLWPRCGACRPRAVFEAESRASPLPRKSGSVRVCRELLWERPLAAMRRVPAAGFVRRCCRERGSLLRQSGSVRGQGAPTAASGSCAARAARSAGFRRRAGSGCRTSARRLRRRCRRRGPARVRR